MYLYYDFDPDDWSGYEYEADDSRIKDYFRSKFSVDELIKYFINNEYIYTSDKDKEIFAEYNFFGPDSVSDMSEDDKKDFVDDIVLDDQSLADLVDEYEDEVLKLFEEDAKDEYYQAKENTENDKALAAQSRRW